MSREANGRHSFPKTAFLLFLGSSLAPHSVQGISPFITSVMVWLTKQDDFPEGRNRNRPVGGLFTGNITDRLNYQRLHVSKAKSTFAPVPKGEIRCNFQGRATHVRLVSVFIMKKQKRAIKQRLLVSETCKRELKGKCPCFSMGGLIVSDGVMVYAGTFLRHGMINPDQSGPGFRIPDPRAPIVSLGSWCIRGTAKSHPDRDPLVPLTHQDPNDLRSKS